MPKGNPGDERNPHDPRKSAGAGQGRASTGESRRRACAQLIREGLPFANGGAVHIEDYQSLNQVLAHRGQDLSSVIVHFATRHWTERSEDQRKDASAFLEMAVGQVVGAGLLPDPEHELPRFGTRVEATVSSNKPPLKRKYGVGTVTGLGWDSVFEAWRVGVHFDELVGYWCGYPIHGTQAFPHEIHVIGSGERPFSELTIPELDDLIEERRQGFWRDMERRTGQTDPSGRTKPRGQ